MLKLRDRLAFQSRGVDANGDPLGTFEDRFSLFAGLDYQRGSEAAISNRLEGRQPVQITVRDTAQARQITPSWRAAVVGGQRDGETFNITAVAPARERGFLNLMGVSGMVTG